MLNYRFAHLTVASTFPLPELPLADAGSAPDFNIRIQRDRISPALTDASWCHDWLDCSDAITISVARVGEHYELRFPAVAQARVSLHGDIVLWRDPDASIQSLRHVLLDQLLPRLIAQRGNLLLHGSLVITAQGHACVILGDSGMGKSTLAGAFERFGGTALTDDCVVLDFDAGEVRAIPSYPGLRLWPDSLSALFAGQASLPVAHDSQKQRLARADAGARLCPAIDSILVLQDPGEPGDRTEIRIDPLPPRSACMALIGNAFQLDMGDHLNVSRLLRQAADASSRIPVLALRYPRDYAALPRVVEHIGLLHATRCMTPPPTAVNAIR